ncbi:hypothetical protein N7491_007891 [Penicillium cf. griseofulvum]|uniref:O-methyltransferase domain-containing protein n=1 Tax=Penicillium cf. griseofulvum TaxID=2972120 RepID=A0A9W9J4U7_9EURO|nr:hypothetical protein N7472_009082 [Penicillium cf. griseofulvum]KAJ5427449.1 hypothetical protein N7491_007891 [Penicillium cf. griseofulvum]KAJ5431649.1 hypothetical protein N7445_008147 [Penicillium cf. griseofulvum]
MDLTRLATVIGEAAELLASEPTIDLQQRAELSRACEKLSAIVDQPSSRLEKATIATTPIVAARIAIDLGVFDFIHNSPKEEFTSDEIESHAGGDPLLVRRILRSLTASGIFDITPAETYKPNPAVKDLAQGGYLASRIMMNFDIHFQIFAKLPRYLRETQYRSPANAYAGPFQYVFDTDEHYFDWMKSHPSQLDAFNLTMKAGVVRDNSARWTQVFPVEQRFQQFMSANSSVDDGLQLVDVGGGIGHEIRILLDTLPTLRGHFILQDVPGVIQSMLPELQTATAPMQSIQAMPYSFFEPQPVTGAHVYFLGRVLHDWPDAEARSILRHIRNAMRKDSVLLIHDRVLPDGLAKVHLSDTIMDFNMMALFSSLERTESQFRKLLVSVGLRLVRVWRPATAGLHRQAVLEAVLAHSAGE